eukprot:1002268-Pleurochrysis_carterae.AAC.1
MAIQSPLQALFRPKSAVVSGSSYKGPQSSRISTYPGKENAQDIVMTSAAAGRYHPTVQGSYAEKCSKLWNSQPKQCQRSKTPRSEAVCRRDQSLSGFYHRGHPEAGVMTSAAGGRYQPTLPAVAAGNLVNGEVASLLSAAEFGSILSIAGLDTEHAAQMQQGRPSACQASTMPASVRPISRGRPNLPHTRNTAPVKRAYEAAAQFSKRPSKEQLEACNRLSKPSSKKPPRVRALERANTAPTELPRFNLASSRAPPGDRARRFVWQTSEEAPKNLKTQRERLFPSRSSLLPPKALTDMKIVTFQLIEAKSKRLTGKDSRQSL